MSKIKENLLQAFEYLDIITLNHKYVQDSKLRLKLMEKFKYSVSYATEILKLWKLQ